MEVYAIIDDARVRDLTDLFTALDVDKSGKLERAEVWALRTTVLRDFPNGPAAVCPACPRRHVCLSFAETGTQALLCLFAKLGRALLRLVCRV